MASLKSSRVLPRSEDLSISSATHVVDKGKIILCVDDEPAVLKMQAMLLESAGYHLLTALTGQEAILAFRSKVVDLVVMDYYLPEMNGIETARLMKQIKPDVPIVFLSAYEEIPSETLGLAKWWAKKGELQPEQFLARLSNLLHGPDLGQSAKTS